MTTCVLEFYLLKQVNGRHDELTNHKLFRNDSKQGFPKLPSEKGKRITIPYTECCYGQKSIQDSFGHHHPKIFIILYLKSIKYFKLNQNPAK